MTLNLVIPMAGRGRRFTEAGYVSPKPLIPIGLKPMVQHVVENVRPSCPHRFVFLTQMHGLHGSVEGYRGSTIVVVPEVTEGAACTVLLAKHVIDSEDPLLIVNSDQLISWDVDSFLDYAQMSDGCVATFRSTDPKYSYVKVQDGYVTEVAEKKVISDQATAGAYLYRSGFDFVTSAEEMVRKNDRTNGEFYVAPAFNYLIRHGGRVTAYPVDHVDQLGTPEDLEAFYLTHAGLAPLASV